MQTFPVFKLLNIVAKSRTASFNLENHRSVNGKTGEPFPVIFLQTDKFENKLPQKLERSTKLWPRKMLSILSECQICSE